MRLKMIVSSLPCRLALCIYAGAIASPPLIAQSGCPLLPAPVAMDCNNPTLRYATGLLNSQNPYLYDEAQRLYQKGLQEQFECEQMNAQRAHELQMAQIELERVQLESERQSRSPVK